MKFKSEFKTLQYIIDKSKHILLFAHDNPDGDAIGSNFAMKYFLEGLGKKAEVGCFSKLPEYLSNIVNPQELLPAEKLDLKSYDAVIACDSVEHGFDKIRDEISSETVIVLIDHHPDISSKGDLNIIDPNYSSAAEIIFDFFEYSHASFTPYIASLLLTGILGDTGNLQHTNTTVKVMSTVAELIRRGASIPKIINTTFANKKISTLKLWGKALSKAQINPKNKMIATVITEKDLKECQAKSEDIGEIASVLNTVPGTSFSLVLTQKDKETIKGSLRSEDYKNVDVSSIAHQMGGGGHKLASGFTIKGRIVEKNGKWKIV